jgi:hypothetical protein
MNLQSPQLTAASYSQLDNLAVRKMVRVLPFHRTIYRDEEPSLMQLRQAA